MERKKEKPRTNTVDAAPTAVLGLRDKMRKKKSLKSHPDEHLSLHRHHKNSLFAIWQSQFCASVFGIFHLTLRQTKQTKTQ